MVSLSTGLYMIKECCCSQWKKSLQKTTKLQEKVLIAHCSDCPAITTPFLPFLFFLIVNLQLHYFGVLSISNSTITEEAVINFLWKLCIFPLFHSTNTYKRTAECKSKCGLNTVDFRHFNGTYNIYYITILNCSLPFLPISSKSPVT